jgi:hypothetical protein
MITDEFYKQILLCFVNDHSLTLSDIFCKLEPVFKNTEHTLIFQIMKEMETKTSMIDILPGGVRITELGNQALFHILGLEYENRLSIIRRAFGITDHLDFRAFRLLRRKSNGTLPVTLSNLEKSVWWFANFDNAARYLKLDYTSDAGSIMSTEINLRHVDGRTYWSSSMPLGNEFVKYQIIEYRYISAEFAKLILE